MSILTNFLKLVKPEKNDYVDVEEHISKNYDIIDEKMKSQDDEINKKATKTQIGRIKVGNNLTVDEDGTLHGNPGYTHPTGNGNNHIPANGASGNFLKWLSSGVAQWVNITWDDIGSKPSSFPPGTHTHDDRYFTESEINEKFKNFCPYAVGEILLITNSENPATKYLGTTWQKIEGRFLLGTSGSGASKATGGSNSKTITQANLPNVKLTVNSFSLSRGTMDITGSWNNGVINESSIISSSLKGAFYNSGSPSGRGYGTQWSTSVQIGFQASRTWTGSTNSVAPQTSALGSGSALDITPAYYTVHMWLRLT